ncbi:MAG: hypothetical protein C0582_02640 [Alphaproteobacteria bacterium]|nr:MAG: hypothetical protein C0582_02640 [Alphaproteobacteria bacterium]
MSGILWHKISMSKKNQDNHIRLGSRASPLARRQSEMVAHYIRHYFPNVTISFHVYTTSGDKLKDVPLHSFGGKGLFCKEVDQACINNEIDVAVHSAKEYECSLSRRSCFGSDATSRECRGCFDFSKQCDP